MSADEMPVLRRENTPTESEMIFMQRPAIRSNKNAIVTIHHASKDIRQDTMCCDFLSIIDSHFSTDNPASFTLTRPSSFLDGDVIRACWLYFA